MAATDSGPPDKKVDDEDILAVFSRRPELPAIDGGPTGKWELSSQEVAELVNEKLSLDDEAISRQAIHKRLEGIENTVKVKHGRTVTWRLASDQLNLVQSPLDDRDDNPPDTTTSPTDGNDGTVMSEIRTGQTDTHSLRNLVDDMAAAMLGIGLVLIFMALTVGPFRFIWGAAFAFLAGIAMIVVYDRELHAKFGAVVDAKQRQIRDRLKEVGD